MEPQLSLRVCDAENHTSCCTRRVAAEGIDQLANEVIERHRSTLAKMIFANKQHEPELSHYFGATITFAGH